MKTTRRASTLLALSVIIALAALLSLSNGDAAAQTTVDYDTDNDGYIDISTHAQLNAIRHDLDGDGNTSAASYGTAFPNRVTSASGRMGCPSGACVGYELLNNINLDTDGNGMHTSADAYYNGGVGWAPLGISSTSNFSGNFRGNGFAVQNLNISKTSFATGLFGYTGSGSRIESLGVTSANVSGGSSTGALIGVSLSDVVACYTTGSVSGTSSVGGLVGYAFNAGSITSSYSHASVSGTSSTGGLVGNLDDVNLTNSYSIGAVTKASGSALTFGGLTGESQGTVTVADSYYNSATSGRTTGTGTAKTTAQLQSVTGYTGIYANWNISLDGVAGNDDPWNFGTSSQYPTLKYVVSIDYDADNDGYIDVSTHAQLNAIRHDLDANGDPVSGAGTTTYNAAFPDRVSASSGRMGCPNTGCTGYELLNDIDLDTNGDGSHTAADAYYNSGNGWASIGAADSTGSRYTGDFKGNGFAVQNLFINQPAVDYRGLFGAIDSTARIESLGVTDADVTGNQHNGILVGANRGTIAACYTTGSVTSTGTMADNAGGLAAWNGPNSVITSSYSHASVNGPSNIGGLLGVKTATGAVTNSYSTGVVTRTGSGTTNIGGLIGGSTAGTGAVTASYYDTTTSGCVTGGANGCTTSAGGSGVVGKTTAELQTPDAYAGIYSAWNANLDGNTGGDYPWFFGSFTQYPTLVYGTTVDYDADDDRLIDIVNLAQLNAVRHDVNGDGDSTHADYVAAFPQRATTPAATRMGCPSTCAGYELIANLEFDSDGDGDSDGSDHSGRYHNSGLGFAPIGRSSSTGFATTLKGNGHTINRLTINRPLIGNGRYCGLFGATNSSSRIETLGVTNASVVCHDYAGILVGEHQGPIVASYTTGAVTGQDRVGGLVGRQTGNVNSTYSTANVRARRTGGGLIGTFAGSALTHSYATGTVTRSSGTNTQFGGLLGSVQFGGGTPSACYWDTESSGQSTSDGGSGVVGKTTAELQTPDAYVGIYANWNANLDGNTGGDNPWFFGSYTEYPTLIYGTDVDYDADDDGYIEIVNIAQLDVVRHDLDGNGVPAIDTATVLGTTDYNAAFPRRTTAASDRMGCPSGTCTGYELIANLEFDSNADGAVNASDHSDRYHNSGAGWDPIGDDSGNQYTSNFKGNGYTVNNLFISRTTDGDNSDIGLFGAISSAARLETLGVTNANVTANVYIGILVGDNYGEVVACYTTGKVAATGANAGNAGGLVGYQSGGSAFIDSSYSTAAVTSPSNAGGLLGYKHDGDVQNSYSTGRVIHSPSGSYANTIGGLVGWYNTATAATSLTTNSYWDTVSSGRTASPGGGTGKTARQLQTVTSYTGIYANWNANLDGVMGNDDPWDLGNGMQYPMLKYDGMSTAPQGGQAMGKPDNWNAPIVGELVGVCLNPATFPSRSGAWVWERSDDGDHNWETISGTSAPTYQYIPTTTDTNHFLRAKVPLDDGGFAYTRTLSGRVKNASTSADATAGAAITFMRGHTSPQVGVEVRANYPTPSGAVDRFYRWQRCPNTTAPHTDCVVIYANWVEYTPVAADVGNYLRMYVYYATSAGTWTRRESGFTGQVVASQ